MVPDRGAGVANSRMALLLALFMVGTPGAAPPVTAAGPATATDAATAAALARRTGRPVEITGARTETTQVYANPSGTRTLETYVLPVRVRRGDGWVPVDTRLRRDPDGSVSPGATATGLRLSGGGSGPLVTATRDGGDLSLTWPDPLPAPVLTGDTATYPAVLPGVDLRVTVNPVGFSELLVVHDARAARNPALRRIRFGTATHGLALRADADGGSTAVDAHGKAVLTSGTPMMWEDGPAPRSWAMRTEVGGGGLAVLPDPGGLSTQDIRYPLYIDPAYSAAQYRWTLVDKADPGTSYWTDDFYRKDARVGKVYGSSDGPWRSFFQVNIAPLARATISRAWFSISMTHTGSCSATSVELWHTRTIDPASAVTWNNSGGNWLDGAALDTESGKANNSSCGQPPLLMEFGLAGGKVKSLVQQAVDAAAPQEALGFGLRIPSAHEGDELYWKRFNQSTARLDVEYDTAPLAPTGVTTVPPTACGTAGAPTPLNSTTPTFAAVGYDPNGDNVSTDLEVLSGDSVVSTVNSGTVGSSTAVTFPAVPPGTLADGQVFSYRARTLDGDLAGPYSPRCYFTVDSVRPAPPTVSSTGAPSVGEAATVTFASGDSDVAGFRYGFSPDSVTMWVAGATAAVPVTLWPTVPGDPSDVKRTLYVRAVDRAGNASGLSTLDLVARGRAVTTPPVPGDVTGDRRADVTAVVDQGYGRTTVWNFVDGAGYIAWDTDTGGGFPLDRIRTASGDFNGDGRTDVAIFREDPDGYLRLFLLLSDGTRFTAASAPVWSGTGFHVTHLKVAAGDFNGDGYPDLALLQGLSGNESKLWVMTSAQGAFGAPVLAWDSGAGNLDFARATLLSGDFTGDGVADVADVYDAGGGQTKVYVYPSAHGAPVLAWDSGAGAFTASRARFAAGDVDGKPGDEIVALYDDGAATARLFAIGNQGGTWTSAVFWSGAFDASGATLSVGDHDGDGRADAVALSDIGGGLRRLSAFTSAGTQTRWEGYVSAALPTVDPDATRRYRLQPVHSGKCLDVPGGSTANGTALDQYDCAATAGWQQFQLARVGAAPYFYLNTNAGKCVDDKDWSLSDNAPAIQWACDTSGLPQPNEQFRLDYVAGSGQDTVVTIRNAHSDKCLTVSGASTANNAAVVQTACSSTPPTNQQFYLRADP